MPYCESCGKEVKEGMNYCPSCGASMKKVVREEYTVSGNDLVGKVKELIHEGNVTRLIVKNEKGETLLDIPITAAILGGLLAIPLAALGVIAALVTNCKIVVERRET